MRTLTIATRGSPLALWQARYFQRCWQRHWPETETCLLPIVSEGDRLTDRNLAEVGGKGLFIKALEQALLDGRADVAVHSMKDVPHELPEGLTLAAYLPAGSPWDALVSGRHASFAALPAGAVVGTSSVRRGAQLLAARPDLQLRSLRGSVQTRLAKLDSEGLDATLLAVAGLERLALSSHITEVLSAAVCLPAIGQGVVGVECRDDAALLERLAPLNDATAQTRMRAERALSFRLQGDCSSPIAGHAVFEADGSLQISGRVIAADGSRLLEASARGLPAAAEALGRDVAGSLLAQGAADILRAGNAG